MRTLLVALLVFGSMPLILIKPHVGVLVWSWIGYMNPHRLTWGFTYDFPLAMVVGVATIGAWLFSREPKTLPWHPLVLLLAIFAAWVSLTTLFAAYPDQALAKWDRTIKILLFNGFVTLGLITTRRRLDALIWVIVLSLGFFALKGAAFTLLTGGVHRLAGPPGSFIADNNSFGLALLMVVPLVRYLQLTSQRRWVRFALLCSIPCILVAVLATYSRGAVVGLGVTLVALTLKSRHRMTLALIAGIALAGALQFMPENWHARVASVAAYDDDPSAQGRFQSWRYALAVVHDSPVVGGGFEISEATKLRPLRAIAARTASISKLWPSTATSAWPFSSLSVLAHTSAPDRWSVGRATMRTWLGRRISRPWSRRALPRTRSRDCSSTWRRSICTTTSSPSSSSRSRWFDKAWLLTRRPTPPQACRPSSAHPMPAREAIEPLSAPREGLIVA